MAPIPSALADVGKVHRSSRNSIWSLISNASFSFQSIGPLPLFFVGIFLGYLVTSGLLHRIFKPSSMVGGVGSYFSAVDGVLRGGGVSSSSSGVSLLASARVRDAGAWNTRRVPGADPYVGARAAVMSLQMVPELEPCEMGAALLRRHGSDGGTGEGGAPPPGEPLPAPNAMPARLTARYTLNGKANTLGEYYNDVSWGVGKEQPLKYEAVDVRGMIESAKAKRTSDYANTDRSFHEIMKRHPELMQGKKVLVMGSVRPWYEAMAFAYGAAEVLVVDYGLRSSDYPALSFATPLGVANCSLRQFDVAISISSFEHDGLGRYGDPLNPEGDLIAMAASRRLIKEGGHMLFAVPMGIEMIVWNAHRVYGEYRFPLITAGWDILDYEGVVPELNVKPGAASDLQPVWLLRNARLRM